MNKKCSGCGVKLQTERKDLIGYTTSEDKSYCMRCFRLIHYRDYQNAYVNVSGQDIIDKLATKKGIVFFFVDFLNLHQETFKYYHQIKNPKILIISKLDIIPESIYLKRIMVWLKNYYHVEEPILFVSKHSNNSYKKIMKYIESASEESIYFVGMTNAGKSTFIESILTKENLPSYVTVSMMPNTTLDFIKIPIRDKALFDTPGLPYDYFKVESKDLKKTNVEEEIKPKTYLLKTNASLIIEDYFRVSSDIENSFTFYGSNKLNIEKYYEKNQKLLEKEKLEIKVPEETNLYIKGIGFFYIKESSTITLHGLKKDNISVVPSFLGGEYHG